MTPSAPVPLRILLADDYPAFLRSITRFLALHNCEIVGTVQDGARLLDEAIRLQPDAIVLDLNMPNVNGLQACRTIRDAVPAAKIIVLTAETDNNVKQLVLSAGASALVTKQSVGTHLVPAIRSACGDRH
jgi:DNA-binding NarL/FixJ family response regulator